MLILVAAGEHPTVDDWVIDHARREAESQNLKLGPYLGREDVLGDRRAPDMCCHVFRADPA